MGECLVISVPDAGIMALPAFTPNSAGIEMQWATNHLGHFTLTKLLLPKLLCAASKGRVVNVASVAHRQAPRPLRCGVHACIARVPWD